MFLGTLQGAEVINLGPCCSGLTPPVCLTQVAPGVGWVPWHWQVEPGVGTWVPPGGGRSIEIGDDNRHPGSMHDTGCSGLVHWDDSEGWHGEGGGRGVQDREHMYTHGEFKSTYGKTKLKKKMKLEPTNAWQPLPRAEPGLSCARKLAA